MRIAVDPLHVYFEGEDVMMYVKRVSSCHKRRKYAESLLKYNFFVDNMPREKINACPPETLTKMAEL